jgi:hypothetical protein
MSGDIRKLRTIAAICAVGFATDARAQLASAERVFEGPNWKVLRSKNNMTDKISCVAIHRDNFAIQLNVDAMYLNRRGKGGVSGYQIRIDDAAAMSFRLASSVEKDISAIVLTSSDVKMLLKAKRLRVSGLSVLKDLISEDLNIDGISAAHAMLLDPKCKS